jgi:hypothetical protein
MPEPATLALAGRTALTTAYAARAKCLLLLALEFVFPVFYEVPSTSTRNFDLHTTPSKPLRPHIFFHHFFKQPCHHSMTPST